MSVPVFVHVDIFTRGKPGSGGLMMVAGGHSD